MASDTLLILIGSDSGASREDGAALGRLLEERASIGARLGFDLDIRQAKDDRELREWVSTNAPRCAGLIINLVGCRPFDVDTVLASPQTPVIEVRGHNPFTDDEHPAPLRRTEGPIGMIYGLGAQSYLVAIESAAGRTARAS